MRNDLAAGMPAYPKGEPPFVEALRRHEAFVPNWDDAPCGPDELDAGAGLFVKAGFPDPEGLLDTAYADEDYAMCLAKDNPLTEQINAVLEEMLEDGTMQAIIDKYISE